MGTYLNPGNSGFMTIRNSTYVDKTGLIRLINNNIDTTQKLTCISRPRRFGKSYAAKMLCAYYDKTCDSASLFSDLEIASDASFREYLNKYDVICLDMTAIIRVTDDKNLVAYMIKAITEELLVAYPGLKVSDAFYATLDNAVALTGNKFIVIIDEWDAPIRENPKIQNDYLKFLRMLFKNSGVTDKVFAAAYMTGILPIKKDGSQSAISDFREYTILYPGKFSQYTGFTDKEVQTLCRENDLSFEKAKEWYDGYSFEGVGSVYNPYSVICAMQNRQFRSYWKQTSAAEALLTYIDMDEEGLQDDIARLISGERIEVDTESYQNDFATFKSKDDVLTLMIHLGYLAYEEDIDEPGSGLVRIPNEEIRREFNKMLRKGKHENLIRMVRESDQLLEKTICMDADAVAEAIQRTHDTIGAPQFYNDEQALRAAIRLAYLSCVDQYLRIEELPSGHGYADVVYLPKRRSALPAMIIELKWNKTSQSAIDQIRDRNYPAILQGYIGDILLVGVSYDAGTKKHSCTIEKES